MELRKWLSNMGKSIANGVNNIGYQEKDIQEDFRNFMDEMNRDLASLGLERISTGNYGGVDSQQGAYKEIQRLVKSSFGERFFTNNALDLFEGGKQFGFLPDDKFTGVSLGFDEEGVLIVLPSEGYHLQCIDLARNYISSGRRARVLDCGEIILDENTRSEAYHVAH